MLACNMIFLTALSRSREAIDTSGVVAVRMMSIWLVRIFQLIHILIHGSLKLSKYSTVS